MEKAMERTMERAMEMAMESSKKSVMKTGMFFSGNVPVLVKAVVLGVAVGGTAISTTVWSENLDAHRDEARALTFSFGTSLKEVLKPAMKKSGPIEALEVCNMQAPSLAEDSARSSGWQVGRTALKIRNPNNQPDAWELSVLKAFEQRKASGESPAQMEFLDVVEVDGERRFRYMKAIPTGKLCLNCHGSQLKPEVTAKILTLYPTDQAIGFKEGDIRGAFTLSKALLK